MGLRQRIIELFKEDYPKIEEKKVLIIGKLDRILGYTIVYTISGGFGFSYPVYINLIDNSYEKFLLFDKEIKTPNDLRNFVLKKFPGSEIVFIETTSMENYKVINLISPDIILDVSGDYVSYKKLHEKEIDALIGVCIGDGEIYTVNSSLKIGKEYFNREFGKVSPIILASYVASNAVNKALHERYMPSVVKLGKGIIKKNIAGNFILYGSGAIANWFLEVFLNFITKANIILIDYDTIEEHNVLRQQFFYPNDIDRKKVEVLKERILEKSKYLGIEINVVEIDRKIDKNYKEIVKEIKSNLRDGPIFNLIFLDNNPARHYALKISKEINPESILFGLARPGRDVSSGRVSYSNLEYILSNYNYAFKYFIDKRHPSIVPGGIVFPHGVIGAIGTIMLALNKKVDIYFQIPGDYTREIFDGIPAGYHPTLERIVLEYVNNDEIIPLVDMNNKNDIKKALRDILKGKIQFISRKTSGKTLNKSTLKNIEKIYPLLKDIKAIISNPYEYNLLLELLDSPKVEEIIKSVEKFIEDLYRSQNYEFIVNLQKNKVLFIYLIHRLLR